jgi:hypothetical protein
MARGLYMVTMLLPEIDGEFAYRIRNPHEPHERIAKEKRTERKSGQPGSLFHLFGVSTLCSVLGQSAIVVEHEKAQHRRQIGVLTLFVDPGDEI